MSPEEEVTHAEEAPPYNKLTADEKPYALFTDGSCRIVGKHRRWKATVWSPTRRVAEAAEGESESSQFAEVKAIQLALDIAEREKWPTLYLYTDSWMVANALWGWLQQWKRSNWQRRGKPIWAAPLWQEFAPWLEKLVVKVRHVDAHVAKSRATEEHQNNQQVDQAAKIEVAQADLDWQRKGELFIARWARDTSGHQGRDVTYRWAHDRGVDLSMDALSQVIHQCETCAAIKQAKRVKPLWYGGRWLKYKYGEAWQIDYITLPQSCQGKRYVLTMVEATTGWLETYPVPHASARNTILGLEKQVLWRHGTPERTESDNRTHFGNNLIDTWAKEHGIEWVYHIPYHAPASGKIERSYSYASANISKCNYSMLSSQFEALATIYPTLLDSRQHHPEGERESGPTGTAATQTPATGTVAEPKDQPIPVSVAPVHKKKYTRKSVRLVKDDDEPGPSPEQEEEPEPEVITRSLSLSELRDMRKDFSRLPGEHIITWLLRCWDNGASSLELEGREAKQLGSLPREGGIDKAIGKKAQALSLWRRLLSSVRERYPFSEDVVCWPGKWTTMERGIQYLRELAVREMVYYDPDNAQLPTDPDEVQCTRPK
ncbi:hypothetical protein GRJ2_002973900 [Grus japonensis]|uniref:Uncharacterized protein n=1 Tax=Grus japonensis TaxID=30415 RepID=A0ABC9Y4V2_GRUJA